MPYRFKMTWKTPDGCTEPTGEFWCNLQCSQCTARTKSGRQCSKTTCIGTPYCWVHLRGERHLRIGPSLIPGAGKGLFVHSTRHQATGRPVFERGQVIVEYGGERVSEADTDRRYGRGDHVTAPYGHEIEDAACVRGVGSLANGATYDPRTRTHTPAVNAEYYLDDGVPLARQKTVLRALQDLHHGDEVIVDYGTAYSFHEPHVLKTETKPISARAARASGSASSVDNTAVNEPLALLQRPAMPPPPPPPPTALAGPRAPGRVRGRASTSSSWRKNFGNTCFAASALSLLADGFGIDLAAATSGRLRDYVTAPSAKSMGALLRQCQLEVGEQHDTHDFLLSAIDMLSPASLRNSFLVETAYVNANNPNQEVQAPQLNKSHILHIRNEGNAPVGDDVQSVLAHDLSRVEALEGTNVPRATRLSTRDKLVIMLGRGGQAGNVDKLTDCIWPDAYVSVPQMYGGALTYRLKAFVCHSGTSLHQGHYVCVQVSAPDGSWVVHDDDKSSRRYTDKAQIARSVVCTGFQAYVLAYERVEQGGGIPPNAAAADAALKNLVVVAAPSAASGRTGRRVSRRRRGDGDHGGREVSEMWTRHGRQVQDPAMSAKNPGRGVRVGVLGDGVELRPSGIPRAGRGLFATRAFPRGAFITRYDGELITRDVANRRREQGLDTHIRTLHEGSYFVIDGLRSDSAGMGGGAFANDSRDPKTTNAKWWTGPKNPANPLMTFVYLQAARDIRPGEEIFVSYGKGYWEIR